MSSEKSSAIRAATASLSLPDEATTLS